MNIISVLKFMIENPLPNVSFNELLKKEFEKKGKK